MGGQSIVSSQRGQNNVQATNLINYMKINWVISATFHRRGIKE
jgi:hypothetical protein